MSSAPRSPPAMARSGASGSVGICPVSSTQPSASTAWEKGATGAGPVGDHVEDGISHAMLRRAGPVPPHPSKGGDRSRLTTECCRAFSKRHLLLLPPQHREGLAHPFPGRAGLDHLVDEAALCRRERVGEAVLVFLRVRRDLLSIAQIRAVQDLHRPLGSHHRDLRGGPGVGRYRRAGASTTSPRRRPHRPFG